MNGTSRDVGLTNGNGKGDAPRSCFSRRYRENYDSIRWSYRKRPSKKAVLALIETQIGDMKNQ